MAYSYSVHVKTMWLNISCMDGNYNTSISAAQQGLLQKNGTAVA